MLTAGLLLVLATADTSRAVTAFQQERAALVSQAEALFARATRLGATQGDRAFLVLFLRAELPIYARAEEAILFPAADRLVRRDEPVSPALVALEALFLQLGAATQQGNSYPSSRFDSERETGDW